MKRTMMNGLMAVALLAGTALHAQSSQKVVADVPFDFHGGSVALAAGAYMIQPASDSSSSVLRIANRDHARINSMAMSQSWKRDTGRPRLVFSRYGDEYFLSEICNGEECAELTKQRREREIAEVTSPESVTVIAGLF